MIRAIQGETHKAVAAMKVGTAEVEEGIRLSDSTGEALDRILAEAQGMMQKVKQMASINEEHSVRSEQISARVKNISTVSVQTADNVTEIVHATGELSTLTQSLRGLVARFQIKRPEHAPSAAFVEQFGNYSERADLAH
jgi:methyl-accepting chemotaxis protein